MKSIILYYTDRNNNLYKVQRNIDNWFIKNNVKGVWKYHINKQTWDSISYHSMKMARKGCNRNLYSLTEEEALLKLLEIEASYKNGGWKV